MLQPRAPLFFFSSTNKFIFILTTHLGREKKNEDPQGSKWQGVWMKKFLSILGLVLTPVKKDSTDESKTTSSLALSHKPVCSLD